MCTALHTPTRAHAQVRPRTAGQRVERDVLEAHLMITSPHARSRRAPCSASAAVHMAIVAFAAAILLAMRVYPGGTAWAPTARGHDFWLNYLCDLTRGVALDGEPNPLGSALARSAMVILAIGFVPFFLSLPGLFPSRAGLGRAIRVLGCVAALGAVAVGLLPNDRFGDTHVYAILSSGLPGLTAVALAIVGLVRSGPSLRLAVLSGCAMLAVSVVDLGIYLGCQVAGSAAPMTLPVLERCALLLALGWMHLVARAM
jgi:hypothetical protein